MGYDRGDSFPFDFEPNGIPFSSKSKGKLSPRSYPIQCERKGNIVFSVYSHESVYSQKQQWSGVQLSERLASLGVMGVQLRAPLKLPVHHCTIVLSGSAVCHAFIKAVAVFSSTCERITAEASIAVSQPKQAIYAGIYLCYLFIHLSAIYSRPVQDTAPIRQKR